jgi:hypothetical protein
MEDRSPCRLFDDHHRDEANHVFAEIVENLHRAELTVLERADLTAELVPLLAAPGQSGAEEKPAAPLPDATEGGDKPANGRHVARSGQGINQGIVQAALELQRPRSSVGVDLKIAKMAPQAKAAAREGGLASKTRALLEIAKEPTPPQIAKHMARRKQAPRPPTHFRSMTENRSLT